MDKARARVLFMPVIIGAGLGRVYVQNEGNCTKGSWAGCTGEEGTQINADYADFNCFAYFTSP